MKPVIITAATDRELSLMDRAGTGRRQPSLVPPEVREGEIGAVPVILAVTGIGKVNAAAATAALLERFSPRLIINTGCAGAYHGSGLSVGDLAVAAVEVFGDEGVVTPAGWEPIRLIGIPVLERAGREYYHEFPLAPAPAATALELARAMGIPVRQGRFVTVSTCSGTRRRGDELAARFDAICENMEGAAVAQVATAYGVECLEIRGISNMVEDRDLAAWDIPLAVERAQRVVLRFIESL